MKQFCFFQCEWNCIVDKQLQISVSIKAAIVNTTVPVLVCIPYVSVLDEETYLSRKYYTNYISG